EAHLHVRYTGSHHFTHGVAVQVHAFGAKQSVILVAPPREDVHLLDGGAGGVHQVVVGEVGRVVQDLAASHVGEVHRCTPGLLLDLVHDHQAPLRVGGEHRERALLQLHFLAGGSGESDAIAATRAAAGAYGIAGGHVDAVRPGGRPAHGNVQYHQRVTPHGERAVDGGALQLHAGEGEVAFQ